MIRLINKSGRALGLPGVQFPSVVLEKNGGEAEISNDHFAELSSNRTVAQWIAQSIVLVQKFGELRPAGMTVTILEPKKVEAPPAVKTEAPRPTQPEDSFRPAKVEIISPAGGWYHVYVNDHQVTDKAVRKAEAERMAAEYD